MIPGPDDLVDEQEVGRVAERFAMPYPQVRDRELDLSKTFGVDGTPTIVVVAPGGEVLYHGHHAPDWDAIP